MIYEYEAREMNDLLLVCPGPPIVPNNAAAHENLTRGKLAAERKAFQANN